MSPEDEGRRDAFDRFLGIYEGLPGVRRLRPSTVTSAVALLGRSQTYVVQTYQVEGDGGGFYSLVQMVDAEGRARIVLPPKVMAAIYRQRDALVLAGRKARARDRWADLSPAERQARVKHLRKAATS